VRANSTSSSVMPRPIAPRSCAMKRFGPYDGRSRPWPRTAGSQG
jgi:hypothetical protein